MTVLIIGGSGFIGKTLGEVAEKRGYRVILTSYSQTGEKFIPYNMLTDDIMDLLNNHHILPEDAYIIICSAISKIDLCYERREEAYALNVTATKRLINILKENHYKFGFISTDAVFDGKAGYYTEKSPCSPISEYGRQKAEIEEYVLKNAPDDLIFRISILFDDENRKGNIFTDFYVNAIEKRAIYCMQNRIFCPTYVKDISEVMLLCFEKNLKGLYNIANQEIFSRKEMAELFVENLGIDVLVEEKPKKWFGFKDNRHCKTCLITEKIQDEVNYKFASVEEMIKRFIENTKQEN